MIIAIQDWQDYLWLRYKQASAEYLKPEFVHLRPTPDLPADAEHKPFRNNYHPLGQRAKRNGSKRAFSGVP